MCLTSLSKVLLSRCLPSWDVCHHISTSASKSVLMCLNSATGIDIGNQTVIVKTYGLENIHAILMLTILNDVKLLPNMIDSHETRTQLFTGVILNGCKCLQ